MCATALLLRKTLLRFHSDATGDRVGGGKGCQLQTLVMTCCEGLEHLSSAAHYYTTVVTIVTVASHAYLATNSMCRLHTAWPLT